MPVEKIELRRAEPADIEALVQLRIALLQEVGNLSAASDERNIGDAIRCYFGAELPPGRYVGFIAQAAGGAVGCGGLAFYVRPPYRGNASGNEAYLMGMYTAPEWRGKGVGTALLRRLLEFAKARGVGRIWLHSEPGARSMYGKAGFCSNDSYMELVW